MFLISCCFWEIYKKNWDEVQIIEAVTRGALLKKMFLKISKNSQEDTCPSFFFNKVADMKPELYLKRNAGTGAFLWILRKFYKNTFYRTFPGDCF